jgi:methylmalonyl-CoA/ethylmalonyl-CoA epimerase
MRLHHIGIAVDNIATHAEAYRRALGIDLSTEVVEDPIQRVRVAFARVGTDSFIEWIEPMDESSPIASVLRNGGGIYHVCYEVSNLEAAIEQVRNSGGRHVSGPDPAAAFGGRRIAWVYTPNRTLVEFLEGEHEC